MVVCLPSVQRRKNMVYYLYNTAQKLEGGQPMTNEPFTEETTGQIDPQNPFDNALENSAYQIGRAHV